MDDGNSELLELISVYDWLLLNRIMAQDDYAKQVDYILTNNRLPDAGPGITVSGEVPFVISHLAPGGSAKEAQNQGLMYINDILEQINDFPISSLSSNYVKVLLLGPPNTVIVLLCKENPRRSAAGSYRVALRRKPATQGGETVIIKQNLVIPGLPQQRRAAGPPQPGTDLNRRFDSSERAIRATYDPAHDRWEHTLINVVVQAPFAEGSMRTAHYMIDLTEPEPKGKFVLKLSRDLDRAGQVPLPAPQHLLVDESGASFRRELRTSREHLAGSDAPNHSAACLSSAGRSARWMLSARALSSRVLRALHIVQELGCPDARPRAGSGVKPRIPQPFRGGQAFQKKSRLFFQVPNTGTDGSSPGTPIDRIFRDDTTWQVQQYFDDVRTQMVARTYADEYNSLGPPKRVEFITAYVLQVAAAGAGVQGAVVVYAFPVPANVVMLLAAVTMPPVAITSRTRLLSESGMYMFPAGSKATA